MHNQNNPKTTKESAVETRYLVMPNHTNPQNTIFGGVVMSWIDVVAAMVAERHSTRPVVTVHIDDISFKAPIRIGDHVLIKASLNFVGKSSMLVGVKVLAENPFTGITRHTTTAYLAFVALDDVGKPIQIRGVVPETPDEIRRFAEGRARIEDMKKKNAKTKSVE